MSAMAFFLLLEMTMLNCATDNAKSPDLLPEKALLILTRESMGCLNSQTLTQDATELVSSEDGKAIAIREIKNPEDVSNRNELYLLFPAEQVNQLPGFFILKLGCDSDQPTPASVSIDHAVLRRRGSEWIVVLKAKSDGFVRAQLLYSRRPEFVTAWFTYPEADVREPVQVTFYRAYALEGELGGVPAQKLAGKWQTLEITLAPFSLDQARFADICQQILEEMDKNFARQGEPLVWPHEKLQVESLRSLIRKVTAGKSVVQAVLKLDNGSVIQTNGDNFAPHLRQKLVLKQKDGRLIGVELWLRAEAL
jgi:hypothetical protein